MTGESQKVRDWETSGATFILGVYDIPLKSYVNSRHPTNEVLRLEGRKIDVSLLTFVDDFGDILIKSAPDAMKQKTHS